MLALFAVCTALPMAVVSAVVNRVWLRPSAGLRREPSAIDWARCVVKFTGLAGTLLVLAFCYWLFPEYSKPRYQAVWNVTQWALLPGMLLAVPYIVWVDRRMTDPGDGYWHAGLALLGRWRQVDAVEIRNYALGWAVKGFFLPFMFAGAAEHLSVFAREGVSLVTFEHLFATTLNLILTIDIVFGAVGYLLTLRILDAHIVSAERTWLGWVSAIVCYAPFASLVWAHFLDYGGQGKWFVWLYPHPVLFVTWGFVILLLHAFYVWATCSFGCRFSNLTNRGIIVDGPYRYMKHPAYLSKNLAWWMMAVPFVADATWTGALRACICLLLTNGVYAIRAWTEERHLRSDPAYVRYCDWIDQHGVFAGLGRGVRQMLGKRVP